MPRNPDGTVTGWRPWPKWRICRHGRRWYAWGPTAVADTSHHHDRHFATHAEAIAWADQKARER